jgi:hypothetical protein
MKPELRRHRFHHSKPAATRLGWEAQLKFFSPRGFFAPRQTYRPVDKPSSRLGEGAKGLKIGVVREGFGHKRSEAAVVEAVKAATDALARSARLPPGAIYARLHAERQYHGLRRFWPSGDLGSMRDDRRSAGWG